jgi:hypothetical protein
MAEFNPCRDLIEHVVTSWKTYVGTATKKQEDLIEHVVTSWKTYVGTATKKQERPCRRFVRVEQFCL